MPLGLPDPQAVLRGHAGEVQALDFDASERFLVSGDSLGEVRVWDLADLRPTATCRLHSMGAGILALRLFCSSGRRLLATQGRDGTTLLWACGGSDGLQLSEEPVRSLVRDCYSFCRLAVLAAEEPSTSGEPPRSPSQQQEEQQQLDEFVTAVLVDDEPAEGSFAATAAPAAAQPPPAPAAGAAGAAAGSQQQQPAAADPSAAAAIWALHPCALASAAQPPALLGIPGNDERTAEIVCCACGACVAEFREEAAGRKLGMLTALQLYCVPAAAEVSAGVGTSEAAAAAAAVEEAAGAAAGAAAATAPPATPPPQRVCLAAGYEDGSVVVWDAAAPNAPWAQRQLCREPVTALAVDSACTGGAAGSAEYQLIVFKLDHAAGRISVRHSIELQKKGVGDVAVRPDRRLLAAAGWDGRVRLYKYRSGRQLALLKYHTAAVTALCFSPRSQLLATAARDGTLALWPIYQPADAA